MNNRTAAISQRLMSLDALRGFDMFLIIGGVRVFKALAKAMDSEFFKSTLLPQFEHAEWGKCLTFQDLIMPLFLFIVGVAMPFSLNKRLARGDSKKQIYFHIIKRVAILWILGMIAQGRLLEYDLSRLRIYCNTLQAIAAGYLIASIIMLQFKLKWQIITTGGLWGFYAGRQPGELSGYADIRAIRRWFGIHVDSEQYNIWLHDDAGSDGRIYTTFGKKSLSQAYLAFRCWHRLLDAGFGVGAVFPNK